jgi:hypothetical protein
MVENTREKGGDFGREWKEQNEARFGRNGRGGDRRLKEIECWIIDLCELNTNSGLETFSIKRDCGKSTGIEACRDFEYPIGESPDIEGVQGMEDTECGLGNGIGN